jgi:hypothetical protein
MMKGGMIAIIAGIAAAVIVAGVVTYTVVVSGQQLGTPPDGTGTGGKKITIELNEDLGLKEQGPK